MIAKTAYIEEADKTVFLLQKTAQLLRYSLDYMGKSVTLAREIEMLGNYVYLQEQRFGRRELRSSLNSTRDSIRCRFRA